MQKIIIQIIAAIVLIAAVDYNQYRTDRNLTITSLQMNLEELKDIEQRVADRAHTAKVAHKGFDTEYFNCMPTYVDDPEVVWLYEYNYAIVKMLGEKERKFVNAERSNSDIALIRKAKLREVRKAIRATKSVLERL